MQATDSVRIAQRSRSASGTPRVLAPREIERLVEEARRLVPMIARRHMGRGLAFEDLIGAGNVGIVEAAYRFDPKRGVKFGTYASWWILRAITYALETTGAVVTVPRYSFVRRRHVMDAITRGRQSGKRDLSIEDVAPGLGLTKRQAQYALAFSMGAVSLDAPVSPGSNQRWEDQIASPAEEGPEMIAMGAERTRVAREALRVLSPRQRVVILLRYGGTGDQPSLRSVGRVLDLSAERVRQIEADALEAVRRKLARTAP